MATHAQSLLPELPAHWGPLCVSRLHYQVTWTTRDRRPVLTRERAAATRRVMARLAAERGVQLVSVGVVADRVHLLLSLRPSDCAGSVVRELKGRSALELLAERPELRIGLGGNLVWSEHYRITTVSPGMLGRRAERLRRLDEEAPED